MNKLRISCLIIVLIFGSTLILRHFDRLSPLNLATKTCLITGASSGIGKHLAIEMVQRGWKVIGIARRTDLLHQLSQELGQDKFIPFVCDVSNLEQVHHASEVMKAQGLQPTLFFLNAGTGDVEKKWTFSTAHHQQTFATNYFGTMAFVEAWLLPVKKLGGGTFVATSSIVAHAALPGSAAYCASKRAILHCFDALRRQYLYDNINFSVILPGPVSTEMLKIGDANNPPYTHTPAEEARIIVNQVFAGKKQIEPSWFYAVFFRLINFLPDAVIIKIFGS